MNYSSDGDDDYVEQLSNHRRKRRKTGKATNNKNNNASQRKASISKTRVKTEDRDSESLWSTQGYIKLFEPLLSALQHEFLDTHEGYDVFEEFVEPILEEYAESVINWKHSAAKCDECGNALYPISRLQAKRTLDNYGGKPAVLNQSSEKAVAVRRLKSLQNSLRSAALSSHSTSRVVDRPLTPLSTARTTVSSVQPEILDALYAIQSTPYKSSFLSRLQSSTHSIDGDNDVVAMDWETRSPWIELMSDIKAHFTFMHPDEAETVQGDASQVISPIKYTTLRCEHLPQIHQILQATFWDGIDVSDCLQCSPKQTTIIAVYKHLVVGCAFLSSPQETYLTYLAVRPGWEGANIATCMLYHLISRNPNKDITLHVSIKNPAMLLYNRFGFKAEEFIVGFYDEYMDTKNKPAKNAFRLRLRR